MSEFGEVDVLVSQTLPKGTSTVRGEHKMTNLTAKHCSECEAGRASLDENQFTEMLKQLRGWEITNKHHLCKSYDFPDFISALDWVNDIGGLAEEEGHHPDLHLSWGKVRVELWTHKVGGLTENDFILAAKIDALSGW
jgi:4a-hydroxytetrahydrobiopterin dehydratase